MERPSDLTNPASFAPPALGRALRCAERTAITETGWNRPGSDVRFGRCGLVGAWWKALEIEFNVSLAPDAPDAPDAERPVPVVVTALRTDAPDDLPGRTVWIKDEDGVFVERAFETRDGLMTLREPAATTAARVRFEARLLHTQPRFVKGWIPPPLASLRLVLRVPFQRDPIV